MTPEVTILIVTALSIGFIHTLLGPDHYIPFVAMSEAGGWSTRKTVGVTFVCGLGHVAGSVLIGAVGLALGTMAMQLETFEAIRGSLASWLLIGFGFTYMTWGLRRAIRNITHSHAHDSEHMHVHEEVSDGVEESDTAGKAKRARMTPWVLFAIFVLGPCEPLIPLLMYPAAKANVVAMVLVVGAFALATVLTMTAAVVLIQYGLSAAYMNRLNRYSHALAGAAILMCGLLVKAGL